MMKAFVVLLALLAGSQDKLAPLLERWKSGTEVERLKALRDAVALRREVGDAALAKFAEPPLPTKWERADELIDVVSSEKIVSWYGLLVPLLSNADPDLRGRAVEELGRRELQALSGSVVPLLKDGESRVSWQAAFTLIQMDARDRVPEIAPLLKDPDASLRVNVHYVLCRLGSREHGPLLAPLLDDPDPAVAIAAVEALGDFKARDYAGRIVRFLGAPDPRHRKAAIAALAGMGAKEQAGKIAARLADEEVLVRWEAVRALGRLKARDRAGEIVAMADDDGALSPVLEALGDLGLRELAPHILPHLEVPDPGIRWRAVRALGRVDAKDDAKRIAGMLKDDDSFVRLCALRALAATGSAERAGEMLSLLQDEEADVCQGAAEEASALASPEQIRSVVPLLGSDDPFVRWSALHLIVAADARELLPSIAARLRSGTSVDGDVVWAIGRLGGREHRDKLVEALGNEEASVRLQAAFALARISDAAGELEAVERTSQGAPKLAAGVALARLGRKDRAALAALLKEFVHQRDEPDYKDFPGELFDALLAGQEKGLTAALSKPVKAEKRIESIEDLRALLSKAGVTLSPDDALELRRRLPAGSAMSARRALEWSFGDDRRLIPDGANVAVVDSARALAYWQKRLDAP
jgi:HEAT repeat protein